MTNAELLEECKKGIGIPNESTNMDGPLNTKLKAVKAYMKGAGVSDAKMEDDLAVGVIVIGVTDIWSIDAGEIKFSPVFNLMLCQLAVGSLTSTE